MLSACLIVKNESDNLRRCLSSIRNTVSQIVVVDTGSTDDTVATASLFGADTYSYPWDSDFSAARNFSLSKASRSWVLVIDADEVLDGGVADGLLQKLRKTKSDALTVQIYNYLGHPAQSELMVGNAVRLFRSDKGYAYQGIVHEDITPSIQELGGRVAPTDVILHHYGYLEKEAQGGSRFARNVRLLQLRLDTDRKDGIAWFYLGTEYFVTERFVEAVKCYERALELIERGSPIRSRLMRNLVEGLRRTGNVQRARMLVIQALHQYPDFSDLWYLRGLVEEEAGEPINALPFFDKAASIKSFGMYETNVTATKEKARLRAASVLYDQGDYIGSLEHLAQVIEANPRNVAAYAEAVRSYVKMGEFAAAEELLQLAMDVDPALRTQLNGIAERLSGLTRRLPQDT